MLKVKLTREPAYFDHYDLPCYPSAQVKGIAENQNNHLLQQALTQGYTASVASTLHRWLSQQISLAAQERPLDVLEIGGGRGTFFDVVKKDIRTYINIDPGKILLQGPDLKRLADPRYTCIKCSADDIPLEDESVDLVISIASLDHVPDYRKALTEVVRLLRKNGSFLLTLNNRRSWWKMLLSRTDYLRRRQEEIAKEHYFQWSFDDCNLSLCELLSVKSMSTLTFCPFVPRWWKWFLPVSDLVGKPLFHKYGANIVAVCVKSG